MRLVDQWLFACVRLWNNPPSLFKAEEGLLPGPHPANPPTDSSPPSPVTILTLLWFWPPDPGPGATRLLKAYLVERGDRKKERRRCKERGKGSPSPFPFSDPHFSAVLSSSQRKRGEAGRQIGKRAAPTEELLWAPFSAASSACPSLTPLEPSQAQPRDPPTSVRAWKCPTPLCQGRCPPALNANLPAQSANDLLEQSALYCKQVLLIFLLNFRYAYFYTFIHLLRRAIWVHQCSYLHLKTGSIILTIFLLLKTNCLFYLHFYNNIWIILLLMFLLLQMVKLPYIYVYIKHSDLHIYEIYI